MKNKILLVVDIRNWAFDKIAKNIIKFLNNDFNFEVIYVEDYLANLTKLYEFIFLKKNFDLVHFFWRYQFFSFFSNLNYTAGIDYLLNQNKRIKILSQIMRKTITTSVMDHAFLDNPDFNFLNFLIVDFLVDGVTVSSRKLEKIYKRNCKTSKIFYAPDGINLDIFYNKEQKKLPNKKIYLGWVGNSKWATKKNEDVKGLNSIIIPAFKLAKREAKKYNIDLELKIVDRAQNNKILSTDEMVKYYKSIDIYLNASLHEGTPNPVLESMAMGIPIITTDVGIVKEAFGQLQKKFIIKRDINFFSKNILRLIKDKKLYEKISNENKLMVKNFDIQKTILNYKTFFQSVLKNKNDIAKLKNLLIGINEIKIFQIKNILKKEKIIKIFNKKIGISFRKYD